MATTNVGQTVSRRLRKAGFNVSVAARRNAAEGLFVRGIGDTASILIDFGSTAENVRVMKAVSTEARSWGVSPDGIDWLPQGDTAIKLYVRFTERR